MAAPVIGGRCVRLGNFVELLLVSSRLRLTVLPCRHLASQKTSQTRRPTKGSLFYVVIIHNLRRGHTHLNKKLLILSTDIYRHIFFLYRNSKINGHIRHA